MSYLTLYGPKQSLQMTPVCVDVPTMNGLGSLRVIVMLRLTWRCALYVNTTLNLISEFKGTALHMLSALYAGNYNSGKAAVVTGHSNQ